MVVCPAQRSGITHARCGARRLFHPTKELHLKKMAHIGDNSGCTIANGVLHFPELRCGLRDIVA